MNNQLPELWEGSGYEGFAARVAEMAPSFEAMRELISDIGQGVVTNAQQYAEFDQAAGTLIADRQMVRRCIGVPPFLYGGKGLCQKIIISS